MGRTCWLSGSVAIAALVMCTASAAQAGGRIKVCRIPGLAGVARESEYIPADGTYGGACDANGDHCRNIVVAVTASATLKAGKSCVELDAVLVQEDGQPLLAGQKLIPNWDTGSFESVTTVIKSFK